jgi:glycosyltransferase involved in cell wall biosynthesis
MDDRDDITVAIPSHIGRDRQGAFLARAVASVSQQKLPARAISIAIDTEGRGAAHTRQRALNEVSTAWVAFLDSDDYLKPEHLLALSRWGRKTGADYIYSHYLVEGGDADPRLWALGKPFNSDAPHETTTTILVRTSLAREVGIMQPGLDAESLQDGRLHAGEDWQFTLGCVKAGAKIVHYPKITWTWHWHGQNTSGIPGRGDAA